MGPYSETNVLIRKTEEKKKERKTEERHREKRDGCVKTETAIGLCCHRP